MTQHGGQRSAERPSPRCSRILSAQASTVRIRNVVYFGEIHTLVCVWLAAVECGCLRLGKHFSQCIHFACRPAWQLIACQRWAAGLADQTDPHSSGAAVVVVLSMRKCGSGCGCECDAAFVNDVADPHTNSHVLAPISALVFLSIVMRF